MRTFGKRFVFLLIVVLLVGGCIRTRGRALRPLPASISSPSKDINNTHWFVKELDNAPLSDDITITLDVEPDMLSGTMVCNDYFYEYEIQPDGGWLFTLKDKTVAKCPQAEKVETQYLALLGRTHSYEILSDDLLLKDEEGQTLLTFSRQPIFTPQSRLLMNQTWQLDKAQDIENTSAFTIRFEKGSLFITTTCSNFIGSYQMKNERIRITGMKTADYNKSCEEKDRAIERQFLNLLSRVALYRIDDYQLLFYSPTKKALLSFIPAAP